jgi:hypothetical protein
MALIVTPGAPDADAMISLAYFQAYCAGRGYDLSAYDATIKQEPAIRRGSTAMNTSFPWKGTKLNGRAQAQSWPRIGVVDSSGEIVDSATIPTEVEQAAAEASWQELKKPGVLTPVVTPSAQVKSKQIGPMRKEFFEGSGTPEAARPVMLLVQDLVAGLIASTSATSANALVGEAVRW